MYLCLHACTCNSLELQQLILKIQPQVPRCIMYMYTVFNARMYSVAVCIVIIVDVVNVVHAVHCVQLQIICSARPPGPLPLYSLASLMCIKCLYFHAAFTLTPKCFVPGKHDFQMYCMECMVDSPLKHHARAGCMYTASWRL